MMIYNLCSKIKKFLFWPLMKKIRYIDYIFLRLKMQTLYRYVFQDIGEGCLIRKPLFITPEFIQLGDGVIIWDNARIEAISNYGGVSFNPKIILKNGVSIQQRCHITAAGELIIGENSIISFDVMIQDTDHEYKNIDTPVAEQPLIVTKTVIGKNCFIGSGAKLQAGTILGNNCVVGANSVVRGEYPDYSVIVGIPARIIKRYNKATGKWAKTESDGSFL